MKEDGDWKLELCRASKEMFKSGLQSGKSRFPELIECELVYNDEIEK